MVDIKKIVQGALDKAWDPISDTIQNPLFADILNDLKKSGIKEEERSDYLVVLCMWQWGV